MTVRTTFKDSICSISVGWLEKEVFTKLVQLTTDHTYHIQGLVNEFHIPVANLTEAEKLLGVKIERPRQSDSLPLHPRFNGSDYNPEIDDKRLTGQIKRVFDLMSDGEWRTLFEISLLTKDPPASISAQLRHLRKKRFGSYIIDKRPRGDRKHGLYEYRFAGKKR